MKTILATTVFLLASTSAFADGAYVSAYGGFNNNSVVSAPFVDEETGAVVGATIGKDIPAVKGLRIELDVSNRTNDVEIFGGKISAVHETTAVMGNVAYDLPFDGKVKPYILAGLGYAHTSATFENVGLLSLESSGVAWQVGGGLNYQVSEGTKVGLGYRYMQAPEIDVLGFELSDGVNHAFIAQATFDLN